MMPKFLKDLFPNLEKPDFGALFGGGGGDEEVSAKSLSELSAKAISGRTVDFASFKGKPVLVVNVASK
jgi:hypothetical protein